MFFSGCFSGLWIMGITGIKQKTRLNCKRVWRDSMMLFLFCCRSFFLGNFFFDFFSFIGQLGVGS